MERERTEESEDCRCARGGAEGGLGVAMADPDVEGGEGEEVSAAAADKELLLPFVLLVLELTPKPRVARDIWSGGTCHVAL
jgi:hypothetical protein